MKLSDGQVKVLRETMLREFPESQQNYFITLCETAGLNPLQKQIHATKFQNKIVPVVAIDGLRAIAQRTGEYEGQVGPLYTSDGSTWTETWLDNGPPKAAKVGVLRRGFKDPVFSVATIKEHGGSGRFWNNNGGMPAHMLGIRAEGFALRRAFPESLSGLYTEEELDIAPEPDSPTEAKNDSLRGALGIETKPEAAPEQPQTDPEPEPENVIGAETWASIEKNLKAAKTTLPKLRGAMKAAGKDVDGEPETWSKELVPGIEAWIDRVVEQNKEKA